MGEFQWFLFAENKFNTIGPIYYEYGSMVITYEDAGKAVRALYALREAKYEDKHLLGTLTTPLLQAINSSFPHFIPVRVKYIVHTKTGTYEKPQTVSHFSYNTYFLLIL